MKRRKFIRYGVSSLLAAPLIQYGCGRTYYEDLYASPLVSVRDQFASSLQFRPGQMVAEFNDVCFNEEVGVVHGPVRTQFGYHLIEVTARDE